MNGGEVLFRSVDNGETWEIISQGCGNVVVDFAPIRRIPLGSYGDAGVQTIVVRFGGPDQVSQLERFVKDVMPNVK
jgi:hypothetical protein